MDFLKWNFFKMELLYFNSLREVESYWDKLDLKYHPIYSNYNFYDEYYYVLNKISSKYYDPLILVGIELNKVVGILPLIKQKEMYYTLGSIHCFSYEPQVYKEYLHLFLETSKVEFIIDDISMSYMNRSEDYSKYYYWYKTNVVDLRNIYSIEQYLSSLKKSKKRSIEKVISLNKEVIVKEGIPENYEQYVDSYCTNCGYLLSTKEEFLSFNTLFKYSPEMLDLTFYKDNKVIAITRCTIIDKKVTDYICIRPTMYKNLIGLYSIFKNIEYSIDKKVDYYDLCTCFGFFPEYKKTFINQDYLFSPTGVSLNINNSKNFIPPYFKGKWVFELKNND